MTTLSNKINTVGMKELTVTCYSYMREYHDEASVKKLIRKLPLALGIETALLCTGSAQAVSTDYSNHNIFRVGIYDLGEAIPGDPMFLLPSFQTTESIRDVSETSPIS